jgi:hypothetical protein
LVGPGYRVGNSLLARRDAHRISLGQGGASRFGKVELVREAAPGDVAAVVRLEIRQQLTANGRTQAVGTDDDISTGALATREPRGRPVSLQLDPLEGHARVVSLVGEHGPQGLEQPAPRGHPLAEVDLRHDAACPVERDSAGELDAQGLLGLFDAGGQQPVDETGKDRDSGATTLEDTDRPLVDVDIPATAMEQIPGDEARDRAADDDDAPVWLSAPAARTAHSVASGGRPDCRSVSFTLER